VGILAVQMRDGGLCNSQRTVLGPSHEGELEIRPMMDTPPHRAERS